MRASGGHIEVEEEIQRKKVNEQPKQGRYKVNGREHRPKSTEEFSGRRSDERCIPYVYKRDNMKDRSDNDLPRPKFSTSYKSLMTKEDVVDKLRFPTNTDQTLVKHKEAWCEFHQAHDHDTERCLTLLYQLSKLVKEGFLAKYTEDTHEKERKDEDPPQRRNHEAPILGTSTP